MSTYPMDFQKVSWLHKGGTKEYHATLIVNGDGKATIVRRFGKKNAANQFLIEQHANQAAGEKSLAAHMKERAKKGYEVTYEQDGKIETAGDMVRVVGRVIFPKIGATAVSHIDPAFDVSKMRDVEPPRFDDEGNFLGNAPARTIQYTAEQLEAAEAKKIAEREALKAVQEVELRQHANYGRF